MNIDSFSNSESFRNFSIENSIDIFRRMDSTESHDIKDDKERTLFERVDGLEDGQTRLDAPKLSDIQSQALLDAGFAPGIPPCIGHSRFSAG